MMIRLLLAATLAASLARPAAAWARSGDRSRDRAAIGGATDSSTSFGVAVKLLAPSSYWAMDEASGTTMDDQVSTNDGTAGLGITVAQPSMHGDLEGASVSVNGLITGSIAVADAANLQLTSAGTVLWTMSRTASAGTMGIWAKDDCSGERFGLVMGNDFKVIAYIRGSSTITYTAATGGTAGKHQWAFAFNGANATVYMDGAILTSTAAFGTPVDDGDSCFIAAPNLVSCQSNGVSGIRFQSMAIWQRALTPGEIDALYRASQ